MGRDFAEMYKKAAFKINYVPMDSRERTFRYGRNRNDSVYYNFTLEEIEHIIRSGDLTSLRELSRLYYRTNGRYRNNINFLASLPYYDTFVTPIYEAGKGSQTQITKAFYNACDFVEKLDLKNSLAAITREWLKSGVYFGILQEQANAVVIQDLPLEFCRTRFKDFHNLNVLEFNITYFETKYDNEYQDAAVENFPEIVKSAWKKWKKHQLTDPWVMIPASAGGVTFCFAEDQTPLLIASIPDLYKLGDAVEREEKRDENELYKLLIQRMPMDNDGHLAFELDEVAEMHAGVASMLRDLDTVDVLTTFGETTLENLQDSTAASQSADRIAKYSNNAWDSIGSSELLFNANNSSSLDYVIKRLEGLMKLYLNKYSTWIKFLLNSRFSRTGLTFNFEILPTTRFNIEKYQTQALSGAQYGYSKMLAGVAMGIKQRDLLSIIHFENEYLKLHEKMLPLMSSYTQTGDEKNSSENKKSSEKGSSSQKVKDISNKGGRPQLAIEDRSEKTTKNIDAK